jgi:hypothetical protein
VREEASALEDELDLNESSDESEHVKQKSPPKNNIK